MFIKSDTSGVTNATWPQRGDIVSSSRLRYNLNSSAPTQIRGEVFDLFIQENQNFPYNINQYIAKHFEFALKHRPKGNQNSYRIYTDREQQDGFGSTVSTKQLESLYMKYEQELQPGLGNGFLKPDRKYIRYELDETPGPDGQRKWRRKELPPRKRLTKGKK